MKLSQQQELVIKERIAVLSDAYIVIPEFEQAKRSSLELIEHGLRALAKLQQDGTLG